jgi:hypothetical protein
MAEGSDFGLGLAMGMDNNKSGGFFGGEGLWAIIILAMLGFGNGFGGGGMNGGGFAWNSIDNGIRGVQNGLCDGFYAVNTGLLTGFGNVQNQMASCCCETQRLIERGFCDTNANIANQTRAILDYLTNEKIDSLRTENQTLKFQASQVAQNQFITQVGSDIVNRLQPPPIPAYTVPNPYLAYGYGGYNSYGNCGCGCA